jgi:alpha-L-arabinofuranosidase
MAIVRPTVVIPHRRLSHRCSVSEPLGTISPDIYGHFTENLGGVIYDGVWVGENSKVPNQYGISSALIEHFRKIKAPGHSLATGLFR